MALKKKMVSSFGVDVEYWKVGKISVDFHAKKCLVYLLGFVNEQARTEGKQNLSSKDLRFDGELFTFDIAQPLIAQIYTKIKTVAAWSDSIDC